MSNTFFDSTRPVHRHPSSSEHCLAILSLSLSLTCISRWCSACWSECYNDHNREQIALNSLCIRSCWPPVALSETVASCCRKSFTRLEYTNHRLTCSRITSIIAMTFLVYVSIICTGSKSSSVHMCFSFLISCSPSVNPHNVIVFRSSWDSHPWSDCSATEWKLCSHQFRHFPQTKIWEECRLLRNSNQVRIESARQHARCELQGVQSVLGWCRKD